MENKMYTYDELHAYIQLAASYGAVEGYAAGVKDSNNPIRDIFATIGVVLTTMFVIGSWKVKKRHDKKKEVET